MKPGEKIYGAPSCQVENGDHKPCGILARLIEETAALMPVSGGAGLMYGVTLSAGSGASLVLYCTGKGRKTLPKTTIRVEFCPFCGVSFTAQVPPPKASPKATLARNDDPSWLGEVRDMLALELIHLDDASVAQDLNELGAATVGEIATWVRERMDIAELSRGLRQILGLAHRDECAHYLCPVTPCNGGTRCNWTMEKRGAAPACMCGKLLEARGKKSSSPRKTTPKR